MAVTVWLYPTLLYCLPLFHSLLPKAVILGMRSGHAPFIQSMGCDSTVIIETTYIPADTIIVPGTTCDPQLADTTMTLLSNQNGCDSLVIEAIMLLPTSTELNVFYSCNPLDTGTVIFPFLNQYGCDSTIIQSTVLVSEDSCILRVQALVEPGACAGDPGGIQLVSDLGHFRF